MKAAKISKKILVLLTLACTVLLSGCTWEEFAKAMGLDQPKEALFVLSFHRDVRYPRGNLQSEQPLLMPDGTQRIVERYPLFSSHQIIEVSAQPVPGKEGYYRLFLRPDQKGRMMWMQLTVQCQHEPAVILLDGIYLGDFRTLEIGKGNEIWVELPLDVDAVRALNIVKYANDNYSFFNGGKREDKMLVFPENQNR